MNIENAVCPEDIIRVLLPAYQIPDKSIVTKRAGEQEYDFSKNIVVYRKDIKGEIPLQMEGYFLVGPRASINQIKPDTMLLWHVTAEEL